MVAICQALNLTLEEIQSHQTLLINAFDLELRILLWNNRFETHFGIPKEHAVGKTLYEVLPGSKDDERTLYLKRALLGQKMTLLRQKYQLKAGYYEQQVTPIKDESGKVIAILNIVYDA